MINSILRVSIALFTLATAGTLAGSVPFAQAATLHPNTKMMVTSVSPASNTIIDVMTKKMTMLDGRMITVMPQTGMNRKPIIAKYDSMKKGFMLENGMKLIPGVRYMVSAPWAMISHKASLFTIADLLRVKQLSHHKLELIYSEPVDFMSASMPGNYWIQSNMAKAAGIADLGKNDKVKPTNGLTKNMVTITWKTHNHRDLVMTFKEAITPGVNYTLIPCAVDTAHTMGYMGPNFNTSSATMFVGK
nr:hypothetical protein [Bacilli bacterium]